MIENTTIRKLSNTVKKIFWKHELSSARQLIDHNVGSGSELDMRQREKNIYGEDKIVLQKLYEKWAVKASWHLKNQAIPLLLSMDPEKYSESSRGEDSKQKSQDLWEHAQHCVEQGLLSVLNQECPVDEWEAKPVDVYKWAAISRVELPEQLSSLMEFVMKFMLPTSNAGSSSLDNEKQNNIDYARDKECILGAALAMLVTYPEQCKNKKGQIKAENILSLINENENVLFGEEIPDLSPVAGLDLINKWIKTSA